MDHLFDLPNPQPNHPAKYSNTLIQTFVKLLRGCNRILDPFAGTGKIFLLSQWYPQAEIHAVEIEPEWARIDSRTILGSALALPWSHSYFDAICTSPTYGNRLADNHVDARPRMTYVAQLGRPLHPENSGRLGWGAAYREFHIQAWRESTRVLRESGTFILNIKNHIRRGQEQHVTEWHIETLQSLGYVLMEHRRIGVPSMRHGQNRNARLGYESVIKFVLKSRDFQTDPHHGSPRRKDYLPAPSWSS